MIRKSIIALTLLAPFIITSCSKDPEPEPIDPQEEIEKVEFYFIRLNADGSQTTDTAMTTFNESGAATPAFTGLSANTSYRLLIVPYSPEGSIVGEITEEGQEHQFFFFADPEAGVSDYDYNDADSDGNGIGLDGKITMGTEDFKLNVILRHALNKAHANAQPYNNPLFAQAGGEDDLNLTINIRVE